MFWRQFLFPFTPEETLAGIRLISDTFVLNSRHTSCGASGATALHLGDMWLMKPVTEDQVQNLLQGLEEREKESLKALATETDTLSKSGGSMTARVLSFAGMRAEPAHEAVGGQDVVPLSSYRAAARRRLTSRGMFFYSASAAEDSTRS